MHKMLKICLTIKLKNLFAYLQNKLKIFTKYIKVDTLLNKVMF